MSAIRQDPANMIEKKSRLKVMRLWFHNKVILTQKNFGIKMIIFKLLFDFLKGVLDIDSSEVLQF